VVTENITAPRGRGKVKVLLAVGWQVPQIADALAISPATLKRHFRAELQERAQMRDRVEADRLAGLYASARAGRISAIRELGRVLGSGSGPEERRPAKGARLGKKEAAEQAPLTAGSRLMGHETGTARAPVRGCRDVVPTSTLGAPPAAPAIGL
jgi:hypothetical protein